MNNNGIYSRIIRENKLNGIAELSSFKTSKLDKCINEA